MALASIVDRASTKLSDDDQDEYMMLKYKPTELQTNLGITRNVW